MEETNFNETLDVQGFRFLTAQDAEKAKVDAGKIAYIESHVGYTTTTALHAVYEKSIQNKIFSTPVGWSFLQDIRKRLIKMGMAEWELLPIPMTTSFTHTPIETEAPVAERKRERAERAERPPLFMLSFVCNILLVLLLIAMFVILYFGETDNMINYKRNLQNRYAQYEQELKDREQTIRERERELNIQNE